MIDSFITDISTCIHGVTSKSHAFEDYGMYVDELLRYGVLYNLFKIMRELKDIIKMFSYFGSFSYNETNI